MVYLLLICLALSALLALNAFASLVATVLWRISKRIAHRWPARLRAQLIFTLRVFPLVGAIIGVAALILPSYLAYEPRPPDEEVTLKLTVITMLSLAGLGLACWRGFVSWFATRRLESDWMLHADAIWIEGVSVPAYRIRHMFPVMAVVGVHRPRLFIAGQVFDSLSDDEIKAAIRHELGHMANRDNLKRVLMRACRDLLLIAPAGRSLEQDWREATEAAADEHAAYGNAVIALDLASALIKIARLIPEGAKPAMPAGVFLINDKHCGLTQRVRRLTQIAEMSEEVEGRRARWLELAVGTCPCLFALGLACSAASTDLLVRLHSYMEQVFLYLR